MPIRADLPASFHRRCSPKSQSLWSYWEIIRLCRQTPIPNRCQHFIKIFREAWSVSFCRIHVHDPKALARIFLGHFQDSDSILMPSLARTTFYSLDRHDANHLPRRHPRPSLMWATRCRTRNVHPAGHTRLPRYARGKRGVIERLLWPPRRFPTRTPTGWANSRNCSIQSDSRHVSCGVRRQRSTRP